MKQARRWLMTAALVLLPTVALAQPKKPAKPAAAPAAAPAAPAAAAAGSGEIELDDPTPTPAPGGAVAPGATPGTSSPGEAPPPGTGGGICEIDPSACPKQEDIKAAAGKKINAEVYAVQQIYALRYHRLELQPYWIATLNDQFVDHPGPGLAANFYITNVLAIGLNGNLYSGLNSDKDFNFQNRRATRVAVPLNEYSYSANLNFTYVPVYGKFSAFSDFIFQYDAYVVGGVGVISTRPLAVIDPDNRNFSFKEKIDFNLGIGLRIFVTRWFAFNLEVRDYIYNEALENLSVATTQNGPGSVTDSKTWFGENRLTNNVQAQLGVSIFLPFSWEYKLPK